MPLRSGGSEEEEGDWAAGFETYAGLDGGAGRSRATAKTVPGPSFRPVRGLAVAVVLLLALAAAAAVHGLVADIDAFRHSGRPLLYGGYDAQAFHLLDEMRDRHRAASTLQLWAMVATAGVFIAWFHRVRTNVEVLDPQACSMGSGWAVGVWFVPLMNLVTPWLIARDVTRASGGPGRGGAGQADDSAREPSLTLLNAWWAAWVASKVLLVIGSRLPAADDKAALTHGISGVWIGVDALNLVAAILAILYVRQVTRLQERGLAGVVAAAAPSGV
ncbi:DUF4328 domain-containing protein [Streptomyces crystallinus]|uniref:DUF4328 domain-containing protein n=1 Tax=Streptomyces crystallinus TaxID=68191 RepID=UPI0031DCF65C